MARRTESKKRRAAPVQRRAEPTEEKLPGVPGHLQAAVQQLVVNQSPSAARPARKDG